MNNDALDSAYRNLTQEALQHNLITALNRLQHTAFEKEFLSGGIEVDLHSKPESFFGFGIGHYHFMVKASCFCEVFVETAIAPVPNAPESLAGLCNIRGVLIPVYQIHSALKLQLPKKPIIFVIGKGEAAIGILIDSLPVSLSLSVHQRETLVKQDNKLLQQLIVERYFANSNHWLLLKGAELGRQLLGIANASATANVQVSRSAYL